ncbi:mycofactocin system transcriptional regulator [Nakamurella sp.]|uniref:mycofactocin system transcriptional regulator n=1 Tax=Nakamurella sp. TaxID=1869182 RepID=UPI003B3BC645
MAKGTGATAPAPSALTAAPGRPAVTSRGELERICLEMFSAQGFDVTSVDEIAAAAGIGRRTFFRYFKSKNDAVWGEFDTQLEAFARWFAACPPEVPLVEAIRGGVLAFNSFDAHAAESLRNRMRLILGSPALQAYSTLRYAAWREVVARFAAARLGGDPADLVPRTLGHLALGAALSAYEQWLGHEDADLIDLLRTSLDLLGEP